MIFRNNLKIEKIDFDRRFASFLETQYRDLRLVLKKCYTYVIAKFIS